MTIDILCKVVDNFGDIGVVYRLAKALSDLDRGLSLRIVVDELGAFSALCPEVDAGKAVQVLRGWTVVDWNVPWEGFRAERPRIVLECFACGRPDWFEEILFDPADPATRHIVNLEHLSAEDFAEDFHRMPSLTRSSLVKKHFFMPGFTAKTGGLILDRRFLEARREADRESRYPPRNPVPRGPMPKGPASRNGKRGELAKEAGLPLSPGDEARFWIPIFSYERDYSKIVADLAAFDRERPLLVLAANGRSAGCFMKAWNEAGRPFPALALPFLPQETWDELLLASDFSIVRGEESLSRAALSGKPFLWQAYVQEGSHQLVKVRALLERMRPFFEPADFALIRELHLAFNDSPVDAIAAGGSDPLLPFLRIHDSVEKGFRSFSDRLLDHGDLASRLLSFIREVAG